MGLWSWNEDQTSLGALAGRGGAGSSAVPHPQKHSLGRIRTNPIETRGTAQSRGKTEGKVCCPVSELAMLIALK